MKIDTSTKPNIPYDHWTVESHDTSLGKIDPTKIELYLDPSQETVIEGNKLRENLKEKPVLNSVVLDYLLAHPKLIPDEWKGKYVYFWGTIYRDSFGDLCVRYLCFHDGAWGWGGRWLGDGFSSRNPSAVLAQVSGTKSLKSLTFLDPLKLEARVKDLENDMKKVRKFLVLD